MPDRVFDHIPGYPEGSRFEARAELSEAGVHRPLIADISGGERDGADSIVLSGGYEDDEDLGDEIVYTGHGGRDTESRRQVAHQRLTRGNLALAHSSTPSRCRGVAILLKSHASCLRTQFRRLGWPRATAASL
jgi:putative restriction endonuclease